MAGPIRLLMALLGAWRVAASIPTDGEIDVLAHLVPEAENGRVEIALPVVVDEATMVFARWAPGEPLAANRFDIPEPERPDHIAVADLELILVPLVAFDDRGNRVGRGRGYYDRALAPVRSGPERGRPALIGVAHEVQRVPRLAARPHDVALDAVLTPAGLFLPER